MAECATAETSQDADAGHAPEEISDKVRGDYRLDEQGVWWHVKKDGWRRCWLYRCDGCGKMFPREPFRITGKKTIVCNLACRRGELSSRWNGGTARSYGYVLELRHGHPRANTNGYVLQHILVVEESLGRYLTRGETVHHKNGIRSDNSLKNLELWTGNHPKGVRVEDRLKDSVDFIRKYAPELLAEHHNRKAA